MNHVALKDILYGGLLELMQNKQYFYHSSVSSGYCHWTDEGEQAVIEFVSMLAPNIAKADQDQLDMRAKELVMDGLKR